MKKIAVLLLLISQTFLLHSQGNPYGKYRGFLAPSLFFIGGEQKEENKQEDEKKMYYDNGKLRSEFTIINGFLEGEVKEYYKSGKIRLKGNYRRSNKHGMQKVYFETGELKGEYNYKNDTVVGESKEFFKNGKVFKVLTMIKTEGSDVIKGNLREYRYQLARKAKIGNTRNKKIKIVDMPAKQFTVYSFNYKNGRPDGDQVYFDERGRKEEVKRYKNDELISHFFYGMEGVLTMEKHYKPKKSEQRWKSYYSDGKLKSVYYANNDYTIDTVFYKNGTVKEYRKTNWDYTIEKKEFFENKKLESLTKSFKRKGDRFYKIISYHENGNVKEESIYNKKEKLVGEWKTFYNNSKIKCYNKISGKKETHFCNHKNGNKQSIETYLIDDKLEKKIREGKFEYYYDNKQLKRSFEWNNDRLLEVEGWYTKDGRKLNIGDFKQGNGTVIFYNDLNEVVLKKEFNDGKEVEIHYPE